MGEIEFSTRFKVIIAAELPKDRRFQIDVYGEPRTVVAIKLSRSQDDSGAGAQINCSLAGGGVPRFFSVKMDALPAWLQDLLQAEYQKWMDSVSDYPL